MIHEAPPVYRPAASQSLGPLIEAVQHDRKILLGAFGYRAHLISRHAYASAESEHRPGHSGLRGA